MDGRTDGQERVQQCDAESAALRAECKPQHLAWFLTVAVEQVQPGRPLDPALAQGLSGFLCQDSTAPGLGAPYPAVPFHGRNTTHKYCPVSFVNQVGL